METADASVGDEEPMFSAAQIAAMEDDDGGIPVIDDMMEALTPWRTGDLGCVSIRRAGALLESADGDASVYSYYDDPDGDSNSHYTYESYDAEGGADKPAASSIAPALLNAAGLPPSLQEAAAMRAARAGATGVGANPCAAIPSAQPGLSRAGISVATAGNSAADPVEQAAVPAVEPSPAASSDVWALWSHERTQHVAVQRAQYLSQHERSFGAVVLPSAASVEAFLNIAVLGMREGGAAVLLNDPRGGGPAEVHLALSPPPEAGLRLVWAPADGAPDGHVRTLDIRQVIYCADVPGQGIGAAYPKQFPAHSRFTVVTSEVRLEFSMADPHCLQYFVCGLRHLANQPVARERFLWQRAAALHEEGLRAASFDERLLGGTSGGDGADSLSGFLSKQKAALESLPAER